MLLWSLRFVQGPKCIDATRIKDGLSVFIKRVGEDSGETEIQQYLSFGEKKDNPQNHCCPILEVFRDSEDKDYEYIVLPVLRDFDKPPFHAIVEMLDFVQQTLEVIWVLICIAEFSMNSCIRV